MAIDHERERLDDKHFVTNRISESCRFIGFGLLAMFYGMVSATEGLPMRIAAAHPTAVKVVAAFGFATILLDYFQYLAGRTAANKALEQADFKYDKRWRSYRIRAWCSAGKQIAALTGSAVLIGLLLTTT